jgi:hypothetical protein
MKNTKKTIRNLNLNKKLTLARENIYEELNYEGCERGFQRYFDWLELFS